MDSEEVKSHIRHIIGRVAGLDPSRIGDTDEFRKDLGLDSLHLLEIFTDVDLAFKLELPDESYFNVNSVSALASLVLTKSPSTQ